MKYSFFFLIIVITACNHFKPVVSDYEFLNKQSKSLSLDDLGNGKIMFYSGQHNFLKSGDDVSMNVFLNGKPLGNLNYGEYFVVNLDYGDYQLNVLHRDVLNIKSEHILTIDKDTKVIEIMPQATKHKITNVNTFPENIESYRYARDFNSKTNFVN